MQQRARDFFEGVLGTPVTSDTARLIGIPGLLRGAEAIDSVQNFVDSAQADEGEWVIGYIFCGLVEFGGVVYVVVVLFILTIALPLIQVFNVVLGIVYDLVVLAASPAVTIAEDNARQQNRRNQGADTEVEAVVGRKEQNGGPVPPNATRVLTSRPIAVAKTGLFSNVYSATLGRVFDTTFAEYKGVATTTSEDSSGPDGDDDDANEYYPRDAAPFQRVV